MVYISNNKEIISLNNTSILVVGAAGFIGYHLILRLLSECNNSTIVGIDSFTDYYDVGLKEYRIKKIEEKKDSSCKWHMIKGSIADEDVIKEAFSVYQPKIVVNLAAQAGVRYSIDNPHAYIESNLIGFFNILEGCRRSYNKDLSGYNGVDHLIYASSSSVYGGNRKVPFCEEDRVDNPVSLYAATKKSNELLAHAYSKLYNIPSTGLRFFTVYGPAGRPDMAYYGFTEKLVRKQKINIFNYGNCKRDFTFVGDIVEGLVRVMKGAPRRSKGEDGLPIPPYSIYNIGGSHPENLMDFVHILVEELVSASLLERDFIVDDYINLMPMQLGDMPVTYADNSKLEKDFDFKPNVDLRTGLREFVRWYKEYYSPE